MRFLLVCALASALASCAPGLDNACGLNGGLPGDEVADGRLSASLDGASFDQAASWSDGPNGSVDAGTLSMIITVDDTGTSVPDLIGRRAFPICVPLGERAENSGQATFDSAYVTDAANNGSLSILDEDGGVITGRFAVDLRDSGGGANAVFTDGVFRATLR